MSKFEAAKQIGRTLQGLLTRFVLQRGRKPNNLEMILLKREAAQTGIEERKIISMVDRQPVNPNEPIMGGQNLKKEFISETDDEIIARLKKGNEDSLNRLKNKKDKPDDMATGGRAGYYGGGQAMVGEDLSEIGHGSDSLMARNMQLAPNSMATTSTGLNYLLGQDNDTARVPYSDGLNFDKAFEKMLEKETEENKPVDIYAEGTKKLTEKLKPFIPKSEKEIKKEEENEMFKMVEEFKTLKKRGFIDRNLPFRTFKKMKEKELLKNKLIELDLKYPDKKILDENGLVNKENAKEAIDAAVIDLEIEPIDGLKLQRSVNTEGEQSVTGGEYTMGNFNFSSPNLEEGILKTDAAFNIGDLNLTGSANTNDSKLLNSKLGFNYNGELEGKMFNEDGYRSTELDLNKTFPINDKFNLNLKGSADTSTFDGKTNRSSDLTPKLSYNDGIFNADISKEIMDGSDFSLNAGAAFPINKKTFTGDLILDAKGKPTYDANGNIKRKRSYNTDMGVVTLKGTDLFTDNMGGTVGYEKTMGNRDGNFFFTGGAEKNLVDGDYTIGAGLKYKFAEGGRIGYNKGKAVAKVVDEGRRGFMKAAGATTAGIAALKTGLLGFGEKVAPVAKETVEAASSAIQGVPPYFFKLVEKIKNFGVDTPKLAVKDREVVTTYKDYTLTEDVVTGEKTIQRMKIDDNLKYDASEYYGKPIGEETYMSYRPGKGQADELTKGKTPPDEYTEDTSLIRSDRPAEGEIMDTFDGVPDDVIEEAMEETIKIGKADGGRIGFSKGKFLKDKLIKAGEGKFTKAQYLIERIKNTIKGSPDDKYVQETFPNFIKELEANPDLAKNENVFKELGGDLPEGQQIVVYGDDTLDFFTTSSGPQNIKKLENFMAKHDLPKDQALRIMKMEPNDQVMELTKTKFIKQKRTDNSSGGLAAMLGE